MLVVSNTRYVPTAVNMIVLQGADGAYYYLHRSLYDQCVVLRDQYINLLPSFYKLLGFETEHPSVCDKFMEMVPEPLDILGPFLSIITDCEELDNIEDMCGALSSMSMTVDFRRMFKVPATIRASIKFSLHVREEYQVQWDRFFMETPTLEQVSFSPASASASAPASSNPFAAKESPGVAEIDGEMMEVTFTGEDYTMDDIMAHLKARESEEDEPEDVEREEEEQPKAKSGFSLLRGLV